MLAVDIEVYPNYFLIVFKNLKTNKVGTFEVRGDESLTSNQCEKIKRALWTHTTLGFNSNNYDIPLIIYALSGKTTRKIYGVSVQIITENKRYWEIEELNSVRSQFDHIDLMNVSPAVRCGLKLQAARIGYDTIQNLPYDPHTPLDSTQMDAIKYYCVNDVDATIALYNALQPRISLRKAISKQYGMDLHSKSDAQISESILKAQSGVYDVPRETITSVKYKAPDWIDIQCVNVQKLEETDFGIKKGKLTFPKSPPVVINDVSYQMGIGGLHSQESNRAVIPKRGQFLIEVDVISYYPNLILNAGLLETKLAVLYKKILEDRLIAKKQLKEELTSEERLHYETINAGNKIQLNGLFGKLGSPYSFLYNPELLLAVTLTGQLALLMLIEMLSAEDFNVMSANTDGVQILGKNKDKAKMRKVCKAWCTKTNLVLEETALKYIYSRDVNNYITDTKTKGIFASRDLMRSINMPICAKAVIDFIREGKLIADTILKCDDVDQFTIIKRVTGGAIYNGKALGNVVRFINTDSGKSLHYAKNNNLVPLSDNGRPIMTLSAFTDKINYAYYIDVAYKMLAEVGYARI